MFAACSRAPACNFPMPYWDTAGSITVREGQQITQYILNIGIPRTAGEISCKLPGRTSAAVPSPHQFPRQVALAHALPLCLTSLFLASHTLTRTQQVASGVAGGAARAVFRASAPRRTVAGRGSSRSSGRATMRPPGNPYAQPIHPPLHSEPRLPEACLILA